MHRKIETFFKDDDLCIKVELLKKGGESYLFAHVDVDSLTKKSYKKILAKWEELKAEAFNDGFKHISTYTKNPSFCERLGEPLMINELIHDDENYEVWTWELKHYY